MRRYYLALPLVLLLSACEAPFAVETADLRVYTDGRRVHLANRAPEPVYYHVVAHPVSPLYDWWPCTDPGRCESVAPGERVSIPYTGIDQFRSDTREALLSWWFLEPGEEGHRVVRLDHVVIEL